MSRVVKTIRIDAAVNDWFVRHDANFNGTLNRLMKCFVQRCQRDAEFAQKVSKNGKRLYYIIGT